MRHYIGMTSSGPETLRNVHREDTGEPLILVPKGATAGVRISFGDWLEGAETIASATVTARSCSAAQVLSSPNLDVTISAVTSRSSGGLDIVVTSSTGAKWAGTVHVRQPDRYGDEQALWDYR